jgi:exosortase/archaeosortase family protein
MPHPTGAAQRRPEADVAARKSTARTTRAWWQDRTLVGLLVRFAIYFAALDALVVVLFARTPLGQSLCAATAASAASLIQLSGVPATLSGITVQLPNRVLGIGSDCTAIYVVTLFSALLLAYPVRWSVRLLGITLGTLAIVAANFLRLVLVAHISVFAPAYFGFAHDFLFQVGMVLVALAAWVAWLSFARAHAA